MVNIYTLLVKIINLHATSQWITDRAKEHFLKSKNNYCRKCGASGMVKYRKYHRKLTDMHCGKVVFYQLETERYRCKTCGSTHALLVATIVPYARYSMTVMIYALWNYYTNVLSHHTMTVQQVCDRYGISVPTLYRWKKLYLRDKALWLGKLKDAETSAQDFLSSILKTLDFEKFTMEFRKMSAGHRSFMQKHKNADNQRRA